MVDERPTRPDEPVSMDDRTLRSVSNDGDGEVDSDTRFHFEQDGNTIHARYEGGAVRLGYLVGTTTGTELSFRYAQVNTAGETATGHSEDRIELLEDGRVRLHEDWAWDSKDGAGTGVLEEVREEVE